VKELHPATTAILRYFEFDHLPPRLQEVSAPMYDLAWHMARGLPQGPELTAGLRHLLQAKDCFVRCALDGPFPTGPADVPGSVSHEPIAREAQPF
jgi:hypothetical protein